MTLESAERIALRNDADIDHATDAATAWLEGRSLQAVLAEYKTRRSVELPRCTRCRRALVVGDHIEVCTDCDPDIQYTDNDGLRTACDVCGHPAVQGICPFVVDGTHVSDVYAKTYRKTLRLAIASDTLVPAAPTRKRTPERIEYLTNVMTDAIGHAGYGFSTVIRDGRHPDGSPWYLILDSNDDENNADGAWMDWARVERRAILRGEVWIVDIDTIARGLGVIRDAVQKDVETYPGSGKLEPVRFNATTGERLYFGGDVRTELLESSRTNGEQGDYDVIGALAALECGLFGKVVYA